MSDTTKPVWDPTDPYDRYLFEMMTTEYEQATKRPSLLPLRLPRTANICGFCGQAISKVRPGWHYNGQPADLENGPSPADLPYIICEGCLANDPNPEPSDDPAGIIFDER